MTRLLQIAVTLALVSGTFFLDESAHATVTTTFTAQGEHTFTVPTGITSLHVVAVGATGGNSLGGTGGAGAQVTADLPVTAGQQLFVSVGVGGGANGGTGNPPADGGGESDIRTCSATGTGCGLLGTVGDPRLIVAAGGGGAGGGGGGGSGGFGGIATLPCTTGGGAGGGGGTGGGGGGGGAACATGGVGGTPAAGGVAGATGVAEFGGSGGASGHGGGGGGAGYFGGGGGAGSGTSPGSGGGGGGGSSFVTGSASNTSAITAPSGAPSVTITHANIAPGAPTNVVAKAGVRSAKVSWTAPAQDGGSPIIDFTVTPSPAATPVVVTAPTTTVKVTGLKGGTLYTFTVTARNSVGTGSPSVPSNTVKVLRRRR